MWIPLILMLAGGAVSALRWSGAVHGSAQWVVSAAATLLMGAAILLAWRQVRLHQRGSDHDLYTDGSASTGVRSPRGRTPR